VCAKFKLALTKNYIFADVYANGKNATPFSKEIVRLAKEELRR
jgi:hypothetical protein